MDDLISRQAAINTALEFFVEFLGGAFHEDDQKILMKRMNELPSAQPEQRWIPVSERLPEQDGDYLVTFQLLSLRPVEACTFTDGQWDKFGYEKVLAWQPLPAPYTQE